MRRVLAMTKSLQEAADILGIDQATLWRRRKKYGIWCYSCLFIPTTIGALLAAIGIAGMNRALQANIIANVRAWFLPETFNLNSMPLLKIRVIGKKGQLLPFLIFPGNLPHSPFRFIWTLFWYWVSKNAPLEPFLRVKKGGFLGRLWIGLLRKGIVKNPGAHKRRKADRTWNLRTDISILPRTGYFNSAWRDPKKSLDN